MEYQSIINFWFEEIDTKKWWVKDPEFDSELREGFMNTHKAASQGELYSWRQNAEGRLAEVIVLDQFSRNMFRDSARAFACDTLALVLAQECVSLGLNQELPPRKKVFLYMPYMHSESAKIHEQTVQLFSEPGMGNNLDFEHKHKVIIDRFGRYPHRNEVLGRTSSPEELEFLKGPNSSF